MNSPQRSGLVQEAARIICEEQLSDYRMAKQKARERLGLSGRSAMPDNGAVQRAVIEYQRLFGGAEYAARLKAMRGIAVRALKMLAPFSPRLVGGAVSGAVHGASRVQLHAFCGKPEEIDVFLDERGVRFEQHERSYRFADGSERTIPLASFEVDDIGVDVAVFDEDEIPRPPLNPADGVAFKRLDFEAAEKLARAEIDVV